MKQSVCGENITGGLLSLSLERVKRSIERLDHLKKTIDDVPFFLLINYFVLFFFESSRLWQEKQALFSEISKEPRPLDVLVFLEAGAVLRTTGDFEQAEFCYTRVLTLLKDCRNQDARLRALTGQLEVLLSMHLARGDLLSNYAYKRLQFLRALIAQDLHAASGPVFEEIKARLAGVKLILDQFAIPGPFGKPKGPVEEQNTMNVA